MSLYLAIDTATDHGSVAVGDPTSVGVEVSIGNRRHAAALLPTIDHALGCVGASYADLVGIIVADGPGSFTGLRVGFASAKGLLLDHGHMELRTAPSLMSLAFGLRQLTEGPIAALYDALRGDVFGAVYSFTNSEAKTVLSPRLGTVTQLTELCPDRPSLGVGEGAVTYGDLVKHWTGRAGIGPPLGVPRATALLGLLAVEKATVVVENPESFEPEYGRLAEAQVRREKQLLEAQRRQAAQQEKSRD